MRELKTDADVLDVLTHRQTHTEIVRIFPEAASALLAINTINRRVVDSRVDFHVRNLQQGRWQLINNGIGIDWDGALLDGQHRLLACVKAGQFIDVVLTTGLDPGARTVIDVGRTRTFADTLALSGYKGKSTNVAATARLLYYYHKGQIGRQNPQAALPHDVLLAYLERIGTDLLQTACNRAENVERAVAGANRSAMGAFIYLADEVDLLDCRSFEQRLRTGANLATGDPELALRNQLARLKNRRSNQWHLGLYIKAWNNRRTGKRTLLLKFDGDERFPAVR